MFPRIELLSVSKQVNGSGFKKRKDLGATLYKQDLQVTLFKTVTIDDLQSLCLQFTGNAKKGTVCMFGIQMVTTFSAQSGWIYVCHITEMTVWPGAGILTPSFATMVNRQGQGLRIDRSDTAPDCSIHILQPADKPLALSTISLVLDFARAGRYSENLGSARRYPNTLVLRCQSPVFEACIEILASGDLPPTKLQIVIEDALATRPTIQRYLQAIAETYSRRWYYEEILQGDDPFFEIEGWMTVPSSLAQGLGYGRERINIETNGCRWPAEQGFTASILTQINFLDSDNHSDGGTHDHIKTYLWSHVPVPSDW